jgi:sugar phosphate isomerase/epimerase
MLHDLYLDRFLSYGLNPEIGIDALALERFAFSDFKRIAQTLHDHSLTITFHGPFIDLSAGSLDPAVLAMTRSRFEQLLQLVPVFQPKTVVCHAGYDRKRYGYYREKWLENSLQTWSWLAGYLNENGARLMLENVFEDGPEDILIMFENLQDQKVGFCLDSGHLHAFGHTKLEKWLRFLGPYLEQLHLHDNHGCDDEHLPMGAGTINFRLIFEHLKTSRKSPPTVTLEPHQEADLWPSLEYLSRIWPW